MSDTPTRPLRIVVHPNDNVAIIVNEGGLRGYGVR
jgi:galactarate dehydratase